MSLTIITALRDWYSKTSTVICWNGVRSESVIITSGVRQGGILSPVFFSVYVDDLLRQLSTCGKGCYVKGYCLNSFMYADDLVLLAITVQDLRNMLAICAQFFAGIDMPVNYQKSKCVRIGIRFKKDCAPVSLGPDVIHWDKEMKYLGINFNCGKNIIFSSDALRKKFYGQFNSIYGRVGNRNATSVIISLLNSKCIPILLFGTEVMGNAFPERSKMCSAFDRCCMKVFSTFNQTNVRLCQYYSGLLLLEFQMDIKRILFLKGLACHPSEDLKKLLSCFKFTYNPCVKYGICATDTTNVASKVWTYFSESLISDGLI